MTTFNESTYAGDGKYNTNCTGDVVLDDQVRFERATFTGSFRNAKFAGFEIVTGVVIADSYGSEKQQHTFTLRLPDDSKLIIKGRNLYKNGVWREPRADESRRADQAVEKHTRGDKARDERAQRENESMAARNRY